MRMNHKPSVTQELLRRDLSALGIEAGDLLLVHSSLSSLGWVEGGADTVIRALVDSLGPNGTLFMPALSLGRFGPKRPPPLFDPEATKSVVGRIPERFRRWPGSIRSLHPTHSVAGLGPRADEILGRHGQSPTPCGQRSPWGKIAHHRGKILMLGVGTSACTMFHGPEEEVEPQIRCCPPTPCRMILPDGAQTFLLRLHRPYHGAVSNRSRMYSVLRDRGLTREGPVGEAQAIMIDATGLWNVSTSLLRARPSTRADALHANGRGVVERLLLRH